jgi:hypothetical protein
MRSQLRTSVLVAGFVLSAPLALADITVGPEGSGAQTDSISDAIFNADEGETIFVFAGEYTNIRVIGVPATASKAWALSKAPSSAAWPSTRRHFQV